MSPKNQLALKSSDIIANCWAISFRLIGFNYATNNSLPTPFICAGLRGLKSRRPATEIIDTPKDTISRLLRIRSALLMASRSCFCVVGIKNPLEAYAVAWSEIMTSNSWRETGVGTISPELTHLYKPNCTSCVVQYLRVGKVYSSIPLSSFMMVRSGEVVEYTQVLNHGLQIS